MADGATPNYNLILPEVGASADTWGVKTNTNWTSVDADLHAVSAAQGNYLPLTGGSVGALYVAAPGITYGGRSGHYHEFDWDGSFVQAVVDNSYVGQLATVGWANGAFATYSWVNANFTTQGASDGRYLFKSGDTCTGNLTVNGQVTANVIQCSGGTFYVAGSGSDYLQRSNSDGIWRFVENGTATLSLDTGGNLSAIGNIAAGGTIAAGGSISTPAQGIFHSGCYANTAQTLALFTTAGNAALQFASGFIFELINATGDLRWFSTGGQATFTYRYSDGLCFGNQNGLGGFGAYQNLSDARSKQHIEPTGKGLAAILQLNPVSFHRIGLDGNVRDRQEIGLIAQDVQRVIPEAVAEMGIELTADGLGGKDTAAPSLGLECDPLIAVLVNAVKELTARLAALEGAARA